MPVFCAIVVGLGGTAPALGGIALEPGGGFALEGMPALGVIGLKPGGMFALDGKPELGGIGLKPGWKAVWLLIGMWLT